MKALEGIRYQFMEFKLFLILMAFGIVICWTNLIHAAEKKDKSEVKQPTKQIFIPCHPPFADMSQDGKLFVNANQDFQSLNILEMGAEQKQTQIKLPKKPYDVVIIDNAQAIVSYGPWGELAVVDLKEGVVNKPFKIGESAESMCKTSDSRILVIDSEKNSIYLVDLISQSKIKTFPVKAKPAQMRWLVPDLQIEVIDSQGKIISTIKLPQDSQQKQNENKIK